MSSGGFIQTSTLIIPMHHALDNERSQRCILAESGLCAVLRWLQEEHTMEKLTLFYLKTCPYCIRVQGFLDELLKDARYQNIEIQAIDEAKNVDLANQFDYYLVPTFYLKGEKLFEGIMDKQDVINVLEKALDSQKSS
jgi:thiol-disulfide isomerase/thioredoxin